MGLIVDMTGLAGAYGMRMLAEAGHRVVRVEPSEGDAIRRMAPFLGQRTDVESSAVHHFLNAGKLSVVLPEGDAGKRMLARLVERADALVSAAPLPLAPEELVELNPRLVVVEVVDDSPAEIVAVARAGLLWLTGYPGEMPVILGGHVASTVTGQYVAVAVAASLMAVQVSGSGSCTQVSVQQSLQSMAEQAMTEYVFTGAVTRRRGARGQVSAVSGAFPCEDGYWIVSLGQSAGGWARFVEWVDDPALTADSMLALEEVRQEKKDEIQDRIAAWSKAHSKYDLVVEAQRRRIPAAVASTVSDLVGDPQLEHRQFMKSLQHPEWGAVTVPRGAISTVFDTPPSWGPRLGEHTGEIVEELGLATVDDAGPVEGVR